MAKKDFGKGLNSLIQSTVVSEEPEVVVEEVKGVGEVKEVKEIKEDKEVDELEAKRTPSRKKVEKEKQVTITIPPSLKKTIKKYCANNDMTIKELFINSVTGYMKG